MAEKDVLGRAGEERAARHLEQKGYVLLARNWRCEQGEIDLVAERGGTLVFVEVKTRRSAGYGHPFEAITSRKLARLTRLVRAWTAAHPGAAQGRELRIDAVAITGPDPACGDLEHLEGLR